MDRMLHSVNDATTVRHQGRAWQVIKAITNASERGRQTNSRNDVVIKAANGSVIIPPEAQAAELAEFYGVLYNEVNSVRAEALSTLPTIDSTSISAATPITVEEVHRALKLLKQKKAADPNGIRNEHLKYAGPVFTSVLVKFIMKGWSLGIPESFKVFDLIVSLPKKGDFAMPKNRRGIQIANKFYQIISSILAQRLRNRNEERLHESQAGFRLKPGCRDQRFSFQDIIDAAIERSKPLFVALIDIEKAFDSVDRPALLEIMRSAGVEEDLIAVADDLHSGTSARVRWRGHRSAEFSTSSGVQQGSAASNPEWNLVADVLTRQIQEAVEPHGGIQLFSKATSRTLTLGSTPLPDSVIVKILMLLLADDIASFSKDEAELDFLLQRINSICNRWGLKVSIDKTNILVIAGSDRPLDPHISINGEEIKVVENAKYLGSWYSNDGSIEKEINVRVGAAWGAVRKLGTVLRSRKLAGYHSMVSHQEVHERLKTVSMDEFCRRQRMLWMGHVIRMSNDRLPKILLFSQMEGPRKRGRKLSLRKLYEQDIMKLKGGFPDGLDWYELASDRKIWTKFVMHEPLTQQQTAPENGLQTTNGLQTATADAAVPSAPVGNASHVSTPTSPAPYRRSSRIVERMGQNLSTPLHDPLTTPSGHPRRTPSSPYTGRPRGRRRGSGRGSGVYVPTGRDRGRPLGRKNRRHGF